MNKTEFLQKVTPYVTRIAEEIYDYKFGQEEKKRKSWYATDLGKCPTGVVYDRLYADGKIKEEKKRKPQYVENVGHEGKLKELELITQLILNGEEILDTQERLYNQELDMSGRPDVVVKRLGNPLIPQERIVSIEIKSVNSRSFWYRMDKENNVFMPYPHHVLQTQFYLQELSKKYGQEVNGELHYRSRDDGTIMIVPVRPDPTSKKEIELNALVLNQAYKKNHFPIIIPSIIDDPETNKWRVNWQALYCDWHHLCVQDDDWQKRAEHEVRQRNLTIKKLNPK